jgi:hypothetical protein
MCTEIVGFDYISIAEWTRNQNRHHAVLIISIKITMEAVDNERKTEDGREDASAPEERSMRKWLTTLAVLGIGGIGAFLLSDKGHEVLRRWLADLRDSSEQWDQWNESAQLELERIQAALNQIAQSLEPHSELGQ